MADRIKGLGKGGIGKAQGWCNDFKKIFPLLRPGEVPQKAFIMRGSVVDLAIGMIIGAAFTAIVKSFVNDIISPVIALVQPDNNLDELFWVLRGGGPTNNIFNYTTIDDAKDGGAITMNYGRFIQTIIYFLIVAFVLFLLIKLVMSMKKKEEAAAPSTDWACPKCKEMVKEGAIRCSHCSAEPISPPPPEVTDGDADPLVATKEVDTQTDEGAEVPQDAFEVPRRQ